MWAPITGTVEGSNVQTTWNYDATDPFAIRVYFHIPGDEDMVWVFSRETLHNALCDHVAGLGDLLIAIEDHILYLTLSSPDGTACILFNKDQVDKFYLKTLDTVPFGAETVDIDTWLRDIFEGAS